LKSEVAIVCGMAGATMPDSGIDWSAFEGDYNLIRDKIAAVFPDLFHDFNQRIHQTGGFHLTTPPRDRVWNTPNGRANFLVFEGVDEEPFVKNAAMLRLATMRSHDQYNTTIYSLDDRYRGVFGGRMVVFMNESDMQERGIALERWSRSSHSPMTKRSAWCAGSKRGLTTSRKVPLAPITRRQIRCFRWLITTRRARPRLRSRSPWWSGCNRP
jgi:hypothetical protein